MKHLFTFLFLLCATATIAQDKLAGAWQLQPAGSEPQTVRIIADNYFMQTHYDEAGKRFISTYGGRIATAGGQLTETTEFNTADSTKVGQKATYAYKLNGSELQVTVGGQTQRWKRLDDGKSAMAGLWTITGRENNGQWGVIKPGARKTVKLLTGSRFQWAAINTETGQFFGTGGGTYTVKDGQYTETLRFFSRDNSKVGNSLSFAAKVEDKKWQHSGKSSTGNPVNEIWSRLE
ncbi:hypothetical protein ACWKWU_15770 [Chitinophaga lutea]